MDQEKIGQFIREIRKRNNLSQSEFAERLGVTFQAVSKWENGKNLPDMAILKEINKQFGVSIEEIINGEFAGDKRDKSFKYVLMIALVVCVLVVVILFLIFTNRDDDNFNFNEISTTNNEFSISGSVVYSDNRTSLIISDVSYNGTEDNTIYSKLSCGLYEDMSGKRTKISSCESASNETLKEYLESLKIKMDHYSAKCTMFVSSKMYMEIKASDSADKTISYKIPLEISEDDCDN